MCIRDSPRLTRLNTSDWARAMNRARKATKKLAFDLVDVYARRAATQGFRFSPDTPWQREMEEAFPYTETRDQLAAIADVKHDMESPRPMDRLICGDVGFGKTEVALRAAFKATQDGKQVMVLCPTTILAPVSYTHLAMARAMVRKGRRLVMNNVWRLFRFDLGRLKANVMSIIITLGLVLVPSLFAWYNLSLIHISPTRTPTPRPCSSAMRRSTAGTRGS